MQGAIKVIRSHFQAIHHDGNAVTCGVISDALPVDLRVRCDVDLAPLSAGMDCELYQSNDRSLSDASLEDVA